MHVRRVSVQRASSVGRPAPLGIAAVLEVRGAYRAAGQRGGRVLRDGVAGAETGRRGGLAAGGMAV